MQKAREELVREEEQEIEEVRKKEGRRGEVIEGVEIIRRGEENFASPVTRDREDGDVGMRNQDIRPESAGLEASQHATPAETDKTLPVNVYITI